MSSSASNLSSVGTGLHPRVLSRMHRRHPSLLALKDVIGHQKEEIEKFSNHHRTLNREISAQEDFIRNLQAENQQILRENNVLKQQASSL